METRSMLALRRGFVPVVLALGLAAALRAEERAEADKVRSLGKLSPEVHAGVEDSGFI